MIPRVASLGCGNCDFKTNANRDLTQALVIAHHHPCSSSLVCVTPTNSDVEQMRSWLHELSEQTESKQSLIENSDNMLVRAALMVRHFVFTTLQPSYELFHTRFLFVSPCHYVCHYVCVCVLRRRISRVSSRGAS